MINEHQLRDLIEETLRDYSLFSESAANLIYGTIAVESNRGTYIRQLNDGPALGIIQMEPRTHDDIWSNYLKYKGTLAKKIRKEFGRLDYGRLEWDMKYAILMARIYYLRIPHPLPSQNDVEALAKYWKEYYNTELGKGTIEEFMEKYRG